MFCGEHLNSKSFVRQRLCAPSAAQQGFTFVWLLLALFFLGLGSQRVFVSVAQQHLNYQKRLQTQLLETYNQALLSYHKASPGTNQQFPLALEDLLLDKRQLQTLRHLRKLYSDPLQPGVDPSLAWGFVRDAQGRITRVYSVHANEPALTEVKP